MIIIITILAFTVAVPFAVGLIYYKRLPKNSLLQPIIWLCGAWTVAEIYSFILRINGIVNAHVSYFLTVFEVYMYCVYYYRSTGRKGVLNAILIITPAAVILEALIFQTQLNTLTLSLEYALLTLMLISLYLYDKAGNVLINLTILFYLLSSFPYFFAWEWLRVTDMQLLMFLANIHAFVHAICYFLIAFTLWKSLSHLPVQSSYQRS